MLPFELSVIDLILAIAVIILLILYITKSSVKTATEEKLLVEKERANIFERFRSKLSKVLNRLSSLSSFAGEGRRKDVVMRAPAMDSTKCPYGFGYLKKLDKDASIPDKCLVCSRIMECFSANE
ncbi:MAG: hypothetical protein ACE5HG_01285 [Candidatus Bathyarchaeia archaeon]